MARNRESLVFLIDVGPRNHSVLPDVEKACSLLAQKKLIHNKYDEVGVIVFGVEGAENYLTLEVGGYEDVLVLREMKVVDGALVELFQNLPRGTVHADFFDAIVLGVDMLLRKYGETNKGKKCLCLITDALSPIKDSTTGTKENHVKAVAEKMVKCGMKMDCLILRVNQEWHVNKEIIQENDFLLSVFSSDSATKKIDVKSAVSLFGALGSRNISPVTTYRGDFELSSRMKIKVWVYKKTAEEKFPTLKSYSDKAPASDKFATHGIKVDFEYRSIENPSRVVPPEQRIKAYQYGPQVVPISSSELEAVKFKQEKGVKLLGFTDSSNVMRHYYMKDVSVFIAEPENTKAIQALSALARAMKEMNKVAIVRCVWRQGQTNVVVGVLTPNISDHEKIPDSLYFNVLPFAEDVREFLFPSFSNLPSSMLPDEKQQDATDKLVEMLDLAPPGENEALEPTYTPNPVLERFYRTLEVRSREPDAAIPPVDETLKRVTEPDPDCLRQNRAVLEKFHRAFELKQNPKLKKASQRALREKPSGSGDEAEDASHVKVEEIGDANPVQDFETMICRRDNPKWVDRAIHGMQNKIFDLVESSYEGDTYGKALQCLVALRNGCIQEQEPKQFNDFLYRLHKFCNEKRLKSFNEYLESSELKPITKTEAPESDILEDEFAQIK